MAISIENQLRYRLANRRKQQGRSTQPSVVSRAPLSEADEALIMLFCGRKDDRPKRPTTQERLAKQWNRGRRK